MNRLLVFLILIFAPSFAYCQNPNLSVEITPDKMTLAPGENFTVNARIINNADTEQNITEWLCSYEEDWIPDNALIDYPGWGCDKNFPVKHTIAPGKSYDRKIELYLSKNAKGIFSFRMKFAEATMSADSSVKTDGILISNPVSVTVDKERLLKPITK